MLTQVKIKDNIICDCYGDFKDFKAGKISLYMIFNNGREIFLKQISENTINTWEQFCKYITKKYPAQVLEIHSSDEDKFIL